MIQRVAGHTPPHSPDAEAGLLGSVLLACGDTAEIFERVKPEHFFSRRNQLIFRGIQSLFDVHGSVDTILLKEQLERDGALDEAGGLEYLAELTDKVRTSVNAGRYAAIVRDRAQMRRLIDTLTRLLESAYDSGNEDAKEAVERAEQCIFELTEQSPMQDITAMRDAIKQTFDLFDRLQKGHSGLQTGFVDLDNLTHGLQPAELIVVAGRPSMGKTTLALNIARAVAVGAKKPVLIFSLEVDCRQIVMNLLSSETRINSQKLRGLKLAQREWELLVHTADKLHDAPIFIDDSANLNTMTIRAKARRMKAKHDIQLIIVDYLQLLEMGSGKDESRQQEITRISRSLKALARELKVPVLTVSQLSRAVEARESQAHRPRMSDLRESGAIEQDADLILLLYREEYYKPDKEDVKGKAEVIVAKQRNGPTGTVHLKFFGESLRFESLAPYEEEF